MKQKFTILIAAAVMLLAILLQPTRLWGQATTYISNVTLTTSGGTNASTCNVSINSSTYSAIKIGTSKASGYAYITVPAGTVTLHVHCAAWNGEAANLSVSTSASGVTITPTSWSLTADSGISGSGTTFTINATNASTSYYKSFTLTGVTSNTQIQLQSANKKRAVFWGVNAVVAHTLTYSATNGSISGVDAGSNAVASGASIVEGATVTLTATPASGYSFTGWEVSGTGSTLSSTSTNPTTFTMGTANATVTANFSAASGYITVSPTSATPTCAKQDVDFTIDTDQDLDDAPTVFYTTSAGTSSTTAPAWIDEVLFYDGTLTVSLKQNTTSSSRTAYFRVESATVQSDVITITQAAFTLPAPSFDPESGATIITEDYVELGCDTTGVTIRYTMGANPADPTTSTGTVYNPAEGIYVNANTTIKAIAVKYGISSAVATASYTVVTPLTTMDQIFSSSSTAGSYYVTLGNWVVSGVSGKTSYVTDNAGKGFIAYYNSDSGTGFAVGNVLSGTVQAALTRYNGAAEFTNLTTSTANIGVATGGTITPITNKTISDLSGVCTGGVYTLSGLTYDSDSKLLSDGVNTIKPYNQLYSGMSFDDEETYNVTGVYLQFGDTKEILPRSSADIVVAPGVTASVTSITDFTYNVGGGPSVKSFSISGANLTNDVTVTASDNYEVCKTSDGTYTSSVTYEPTDGALAETTVYVRLESGLSSNTYEGTVTVASAGATSKVVNLTGKVTHVIAYNTILPTGCSVSSEPNGAQVAGESVSVSATAGLGYKFSAWDVYKTDDATTKVDVEDDAFEMPDYNVTVSATFVSAYTVTYDSNGGTGTMTDEDSPYASGSTVTVLTNEFTREGYEFSSWNTKANGSGSPYDPADDENNTFTINENTTLYAQWMVKKYNVALSSIENVDLLASYGTSSTITEGNNADVDCGTEITLSATNMDAGKVFIWSVTKNEDSSDVTDDVLDGDVLTVPAYNITIGGSVEDVKAVYTVVKPSTTITVSSSGICPAESTASYSTTYSTLGQLTAGNYMTLTLSGYQNQIIKGIDLEMHSNAPGSGVKGAGYMSAVVGTDTIAKVGKSTSAVNFKEWPGMTAYTSSYTNVSIPMTLDTRKIEDDETIVIKITATANSLYCDKFTIYYETSTTPVINAENVNLVYSATSGEIPYTITNPNGASLTAVKTTGDWISGVTVDGANSKVTFTTSANSGVGREGTITLSYTGASDKVVKVYQEAQKYTVTYAAGTGGSGTMTDSNSPYEYGAEVTLLDNTFTAPSGKMFNGWSVTDGSSNPVTTADGKFTMPNSNVTVTAQWRDKDKFELVNSTEGLVAGKHYIITNGTTETVYAMGYQNSNNRPKSKAVSFDDDDNIYEDSDIWDFVLSGDATNGWTFYDKYTEGEGFLYAASSSDNHLKLQTTLDANGKWTIDFSDDAANIVAKGSNTHKYMRYNTSGLFSCYEKDKQSAIYLYVKVDDEDYEIYSPSPITGSQEIESLVVEDVLTIKSDATLTVTGALTNTTAANLIIEEGGQLVLPDNTKVKATVKKATAGSSAEKTEANNLYAISSPVDGIEISSFAQGTHNVYQYYEPTTTWQEYRNENNEFDNLAIGRGYLYRSSVENLELAGDVTGGDEDGKVEYTLSYACGVAKYKGLNLVGNPFTHDITWSDLSLENVESAGCYMLVEDPESGDHGKWKAVAYGNVTVKPMQAFFVQATDEDASITFNNTAGGGKGVNYANDNIMLSVKNSKCSDEAYVMFMEGHGLNKIEHRNNEIPMLYIMNNGQNYAIADMSDDTEVINVGFEAKTMGQYSISIKTEGQYSYMHLYDKVTGDDIDMLVEDSYTFVGAPNDRKDRFVLNLNYNAANINTESDIFAYQSGSDIIIRGDGELHVFDVMGRMVATQRINGVETMRTSSLQTGVYIFRLEDKTQKIVVR